MWVAPGLPRELKVLARQHVSIEAKAEFHGEWRVVVG